MAYEADTIEELAGKIGCDAATLTATVDRYNGMCEAGEDTDYYKKPVFLTPVKQGPFYALKVLARRCSPSRWPEPNNDFQCLDENGEVIEGLYVLGNIMGDITRGGLPHQRRRQLPRPLHYLRLPARPRSSPRPKRPRAKPLTPLRPPPPCGCGIPARKALFVEPFSLFLPKRPCHAAVWVSGGVLHLENVLFWKLCSGESYAAFPKKAHFPSRSRPLLG